MAKQKSKRLSAFEIDKLLKEIDKLAKKVSKKWPKGLTAVEAVRRERRY